MNVNVIDPATGKSVDMTKPAAVVPGNVTVRGRQIGLTVDAATALTVPAGTVAAWVQAEGQNVRWRDDGTDPTASAGMRVMKDMPPVILPLAFLSGKFIGEAAGGKLNILYFS